MSKSEDQFKELVAQLIARANRMFEKRKDMLPFALSLNKAGAVEVFIASEELSEEIADLVKVLETALIRKAKAGELVATCIAYPEFSRDVVVAWLENDENYCLKVEIPVRVGDRTELLAEELEVLDGGVFMFPMMESEAGETT